MNRYSPKGLKKEKKRNKLLLKQRLIGLSLLVISAVVILIASTGQTVEDRDATVVALTIPMGLYMLLSKNVMITP